MKSRRRVNSDVRQQLQIIAMDPQLQQTHTRLKDLLHAYIEPLTVWERAEEHRTFWRPSNTRVVLLAESHVRTSASELERTLKPASFLPSGMPRGFVRLVYSLGYGEERWLDRPIGEPRNDGTWQFWKIFHACLHRARTDEDFAPVLKTGTKDAARRLLNKVNVLTSLRERGVWLVDASVAGLYSPKGATLPKPPLPVRNQVIKASWDTLVASTVERAAPEAILCVGVEVAKTLSSRLNKLGIPWGAVHQPQSHLTSEGHMKNWETYYSICANPQLVRHLPSVV